MIEYAAIAQILIRNVAVTQIVIAVTAVFYGAVFDRVLPDDKRNP